MVRSTLTLTTTAIQPSAKTGSGSPVTAAVPQERECPPSPDGMVHRFFASVPLLALLVALFSVPLAPAAHAVGSYANATIADVALRYVGQPGVNACLSTPYGSAYPGECKQFVNCIIYQASGGTQRPGGGNDYFGSFIAAGGVEVPQASAVKGDIIQWGSGTSTRQHTAIVVENRGNGSFRVVDSNAVKALTVGDHVINVNTYVSGYTPRFARVGGTANPNPFGAFDTVTAVDPGTVRVRGWAADPNAKAGPLSVHVYANGKYAGALTANKSRPDVAAAYPGYGSNLGYDNWISLPVSGSVQVCVYGINIGAGYTNTQLGCRTLTVG